MKIRALSASLLAGALMVTAACSDDSGSDPGSNTESGGGEVTLWMYPFIRDEAKGKAFWEQLEKDFDAAHDDIDLTVELGTFQNRDEQISAALAAGSGPDIVMITPDQLSTYKAVGGLLPVTDAIADDRDAFFPAGLDVATYDGELYGVPMFQNASTTSYNTQIFEQAGINDLPTTWEHVLEHAPTLAKDGIAILDYAGNPETTLNVTFYPILWQAGGRIFTEDGSDIAFDSPEGVAALEFLVELQKIGGLPPDVATKGNDVEGTPLAEGKVAMRFMTSLTQLDHMRTALGEENVVLGAPLTGKEQVIFASPGMLSLTSINSEENREAAYQVISYLVSPDVQEALTKASNTFPTRTDVPPPGEGPDYDAMTEALQYAHPGEAHPQARPVMAILVPYIQSALQGDMTPEEAMTAAAEEARELLARS